MNGNEKGIKTYHYKNSIKNKADSKKGTKKPQDVWKTTIKIAMIPPYNYFKHKWVKLPN